WLDGTRLTFPPRAGGIDPSAIAPPALSWAWVAVRILGGDYAGAAAQWPLRFYIKGEPAVSRR
ncbi:MAG: hypothetical protein IT482_17510, partial [Gammaproteobacteria bacterium]|nr:hypothetical protein [Gammaproteobacteria bacterium]